MTDAKPRREKGTGGVFQRADGRWIARLELGRDPRTGKRRQKVVTAKTERDAKKKLAKLKDDKKKHQAMSSGSAMTVEKWMLYWLDNIDQSRPTTRAGYRSKITHHIIPAIGRIKLDRLDGDDVRYLRDYIVKERGNSPTSAVQTHAILRKALKDAEAEGKIDRNIAAVVRKPAKAAHNPKILTAEQAAQVYAYMQGQRLASRYAAALLTGARQGELLGLEIDRVDFTKDEITFAWQLQRIRLVDGKLDAPPDWEHRHISGGLYFARPKTQAGWRTIPLVEPLRSILAERIAEAEKEPNPYGLVWTADPKRDRATHQTQPLDGMPIDPSWDSKRWHKILIAAGVPDMKLHAARHTAVSLLRALGVPEYRIAQIVGHSSLKTTAGYGQGSTELAQQDLTALGGLFQLPGLELS